MIEPEISIFDLHDDLRLAEICSAGSFGDVKES
jgi:hypothetical protein